VEQLMNWRDHIVSDPQILLGKPLVKGTRLPVDLVLGRLADGWTAEDLFKSYPRLTTEALQETGLTQAAFARAIGVSSMRISHVVKGARPVSADLALLFGKAFGRSPQYWLNLQALHDLAIAEGVRGAKVAAVASLPGSRDSGRSTGRTRRSA
jgi:addiction module HigA family antidote